jgi:hypothetical protein
MRQKVSIPRVSTGGRPDDNPTIGPNSKQTAIEGPMVRPAKGNAVSCIVGTFEPSRHDMCRFGLRDAVTSSMGMTTNSTAMLVQRKQATTEGLGSGNPFCACFLKGSRIVEKFERCRLVRMLVSKRGYNFRFGHRNVPGIHRSPPSTSDLGDQGSESRRSCPMQREPIEIRIGQAAFYYQEVVSRSYVAQRTQLACEASFRGSGASPCLVLITRLDQTDLQTTYEKGCPDMFVYYRIGSGRSTAQLRKVAIHILGNYHAALMAGRGPGVIVRQSLEKRPIEIMHDFPLHRTSARFRERSQTFGAQRKAVITSYPAPPPLANRYLLSGRAIDAERALQTRCNSYRLSQML